MHKRLTRSRNELVWNKPLVVGRRRNARESDVVNSYRRRIVKHHQLVISHRLTLTHCHQGYDLDLSSIIYVT